jgi:hypothetical protein
LAGAAGEVVGKGIAKAVPRSVAGLLLLGGWLCVLVGERLMGAGTLRWITGLGAALILASVVIRASRAMRAEGNRAEAERILAGFASLSVLGLALYVVQSDLFLSLASAPLEKTWPRLDGILGVLWPVLIVASVVPTLFVEAAWAAVSRAPKLEILRIRDSAFTGLGVAAALTFAFSTVYVATQRDVKWDLSYFRTAKPGESTHKIVQALDQALDVSIFYPPGNDVREEVEGYFSDLAKDSENLHVATYDNAVDIARAKSLNVTANGMVVISRGGRKETLNVGLDLEGARNQLRNLDKEVQKRLLQVARPGRTIYLTTGHGERGFDPANDTDKRPTLRNLREALQQQSYAVKTLGMSDGLGVDVPSDAALVAIVGPEQEFAPEELAALDRYLERGGRLFVALEPDPRADPTQPGGPPVLAALLSKLGLKYDTTPLANDQVYAQRTYQKSDRINIATAGFSSHPSVTSLGRLAGRAPLVLFGAGHLEEVKQRPAGTTVDFTVRAHPQTFTDVNRDFNFDPPGEVRKAWELAAAVHRKIEPPKDEPAKKDDATAKKDDATAKKDDKKDAKKDDATAKKDDAKKDASEKKDAKKDDKKKDDKKKQQDELRVIVLSDADAVGDLLLPNPGNAYFFLDGVRWLAGDESITGEVSSETDVAIAHTRKQDQVWFYATIFLVPGLVLGLGSLMTRRRRMGARAGSSRKPGSKEAA